MSELPNRVSPGQRLTAHWINRLLDYLRSRELRAGPGARISRTPSGTTVSVVPSASGTNAPEESFCPAVVTGFSAGCYTVDLHADGILARRTGTAVLVLPEVSMLSHLDAGSVVLAHVVQAGTADHEVVTGS